MLIIWGVRLKRKMLGQMAYDCAQCGRKTCHTTYREREWFTLFFIPLIPFGKKYGLGCNVCGRRLRAINWLEAQLRQLDGESPSQVSETAA